MLLVYRTLQESDRLQKNVLLLFMVLSLSSLLLFLLLLLQTLFDSTSLQKLTLLLLITICAAWVMDIQIGTLCHRTRLGCMFAQFLDSAHFMEQPRSMTEVCKKIIPCTSFQANFTAGFLLEEEYFQTKVSLRGTKTRHKTQLHTPTARRACTQKGVTDSCTRIFNHALRLHCKSILLLIALILQINFFPYY
jgi:hypothetical protein